MSDSFENIRVEDVATLSGTLYLNGLDACADLGARAISEVDEPLFAILDAMAVDYDDLGDPPWRDFATDRNDTFAPEELTVAGIDQLLDEETDDDFYDINSTANPFLRAAYLAYFALSHEREVPRLSEPVYRQIMQSIETGRHERVKLDTACLGALAVDKGLQSLIDQEDIGAVTSMVETTGRAHEKIAALLGAGAVSFLLNQQHQHAQAVLKQEFRRSKAHLN